MPAWASPLFNIFSHQPLKKYYSYLLGYASLGISIFYYLLTSTFKKYYSYLFGYAFLGISIFYYLLTSTFKKYYSYLFGYAFLGISIFYYLLTSTFKKYYSYLFGYAFLGISPFYHLPTSTLKKILFFICLVMPPWASPLFTIFSHQPLKKYYSYLFGYASLGISIFYYLLTSSFKKILFFICLVMPAWASPLFNIFSHQPLKKYYSYLLGYASLGISIFYYLLTSTFKKYYSYLFGYAFLGISIFYYLLTSSFKKILFFICLVMPAWASPLFNIFSHQPLKKYYSYLLGYASLGISIFYYLLTSTFKKYYSYLFGYAFLGISIFYYLPTSSFKKILFFICLVMPPWASPLFTIFSHQPLKKYYSYLFGYASLGISIFYYLLTSSFKKYYFLFVWLCLLGHLHFLTSSHINL